jgi:hypothetical protein
MSDVLVLRFTSLASAKKVPWRRDDQDKMRAT